MQYQADRLRISPGVCKKDSSSNKLADHCLFEVFLNGLREDLKVDVRIYKPRTVYKVMSLELEYESKLGSTRGSRGTSWSNSRKPNPALQQSHPHISQEGQGNIP